MNLFRKWLPAAQLCCLVLVLALTGCAKDVVDTTGSIYGIVNDADNGEPVSGAHISLNPGGLTANTGSDGRLNSAAWSRDNTPYRYPKAAIRPTQNASMWWQASKLRATWCWNGARHASD